MAQPRTIFNDLTDLLSGRMADSPLSGTQSGPGDQPRILKANSIEERDQLIVRTQQEKHMGSQLFQLMQADTQRRVYTEGTRLEQYQEYDAMEEYPDIARALDLLAEEATMGSIKGRALNIYSNNAKTKAVLDDLFTNSLDLPTLLPFWTRIMIKQGDCLLYLLMQAERGITGVRLLPTIDVERQEVIEGEQAHTKFRHRLSTGTIQDYSVWQVAHFRMLGNERRLPYGTSLLFRIRRTYKMLLMAKDAVLVYRLTRAPERRVHNIYTGNIEPNDVPAYLEAVANSNKKAPLVDPRTGDINFQYQPATMDMDYFVGYNGESPGTQITTLPGACLALDTRIPLLDGRTLRLDEIIAEHEEGKKLWVYSINPATGGVVPGPITWAGVTRQNTEVLKITLDNGETITVTPDHKFPTRTGVIKQAQHLKVGESLFSFERIHKKVNASENEYEMVYDHQQQKFRYTHRLVAAALPKRELVFDPEFTNAKKGTFHHADFNRWNNSPENLVFMNNLDHIRLHQSVVSTSAMEAWKLKYHSDAAFKQTVDERLAAIRTAYYANRSEEKRANHTHNLREGILAHFAQLSGDAKVRHQKKCADNIREGAKITHSKLVSDPAFKAAFGAKVSAGLKAVHATQAWKDKPKNNKYTYSQALIQIVVDHLREGHTNETKLANMLANEEGEFMRLFRELNIDNKLFKKNFKKFTQCTFRRMLFLHGYAGLRDLLAKLPMYNHRIVSIEYLTEKQDTGTITVDGPEQYHNFHNFALASGVFTQNSNLDALGDLNMLEDDLFGGLGIPKSFIKFNSSTGGSAGDGKSFSMLDLRLARLVSRIQQSLLGELNRLAIIHLYLLGGDFHEELSNFTLTMNSPSVQLELMHQELEAAKLANYALATTPSGEGVAPYSAAEAMKYFLGKSEAEVVQSFKDQFMESKIYAEIKNAPDLLPSSGLYDEIIRFLQAGAPKATSAPGGGGEGGPGGGGGGGGGGFPGGGGIMGGDPGAVGPDGMPMDGAPPAEGDPADGAPDPNAPGPPGTLTEQTMRAGARLLEFAQRLDRESGPRAN